jgi:hypothetical protein
MEGLNMIRILSGAALLFGFCSLVVHAGPQNVAWPANYKTEFTNTFNGDRTANEKQVIRIFANETAVAGARADGRLPHGSVVVGELYSVKIDADGKPINSALGRRIIDKLSAVVVMERGAGFDAEYADELKVGDWEFAVFSPSGERLDKDVTACRQCHHPLADREYLFSYEHLVR